MNDAFAAYVPLISDEQDRQLFEKAKTAAESYEKQSESVLNFSRQQQTENAVKELARLASIANDVSSALAADISYNDKLAKDVDLKGQENYANAKWVLIVVTVIVTGLLALIGWFIYRQISSGLKSAQTTISRIENSLDFTLRAEGELS